MKIMYTGIGSTRKSGLYTKEEFVALMKKTFTKTDAYMQLYGSSHDPKKLKKYTFNQWLKWSGASIVEKKN